MDVNKVSPGQRIAAIAGGLLFIDLWMHWYTANISGGQQTLADKFGIQTSATGWQSFSYTDILIAIVALLAVSGAVFAASNMTWPLPMAWSQIASIAGAAITLLILYRIINQPHDNSAVNVEWGAYVGLILAGVMTYGAWRAMNEDGVASHTHAAPPPPSAAGPAGPAV